jgi:hypothetical protein
VRPAAALAAAVLAAACSRGPDEEGKSRLLAPTAAEGAPAAGPFDFSRPGDALALDADDVARRLGSFEWLVAVEWSVALSGEDAPRVRAVERHRVRQSATGEFDVAAEVDPALGPGSQTGREVIFARGMTYGRARNAPWRERPTDRGRDARRYRGESFSIPLAVARLFGDALAVAPAGDLAILGRPGKRFLLSLARDASPAAPAPRPAGAPEPDDDTRRRLAFLEGRLPTSASGELVLDAATGAPLRVRISGAFAVKAEPRARAAVELLAQVRALGGEVPTIAPPRAALPDERKPAGVAGALDAAGLRKREEEKPARAEPADEPEE